MADVRLVATNPIDSSLVPVACTDQGKVLLADPGELTDVHVLGDLSVDGVSTFASRVGINTPASNDAHLNVAGTVVAAGLTVASDPLDIENTTTAKVNINGSAEFAGNLNVNGGINAGGSSLFADGRVYGRTVYASDSVGNGILFQGTEAGEEKFRVATDGKGIFKGSLAVGGYENFGTGSGFNMSSTGQFNINRAANNTAIQIAATGDPTPRVVINSSGNARFGEVVVTSRGQKWTLVEQGGLCHMVADVRSDQAEYPGLRDVFKELDMIESALQAVMERLRMSPPAGWEVWDGSSSI